MISTRILLLESELGRLLHSRSSLWHSVGKLLPATRGGIPTYAKSRIEVTSNSSALTRRPLDWSVIKIRSSASRFTGQIPASSTRPPLAEDSKPRVGELPVSRSSTAKHFSDPSDRRLTVDCARIIQQSCRISPTVGRPAKSFALDPSTRSERQPRFSTQS